MHAAPITPAPAPSAGSSAQPYAELSFAVRKSLPELRLSMHVYAAEAGQRFVILNNSRMIEGDKSPDEVTLREIRPDGVVLEFQGQRFFLPRDGL
jgi:general secretion pathway protein B